MLMASSVAFTAAACGSSGDDDAADGKTRITVNCEPPKSAKTDRSFFDADVAAFEKANPDIDVVTHDAFPCQDPKTFDAKLAGGQMEDVFYTYFTDAKHVVDVDQAADITSYVKDLKSYGTIQQQLRDIYTVDGKIYGVPRTGYSMGLVYNKALFKKAGITEAPKTWDELKADAAKVQDKAKVDGYWGSTQAYYAQSFLYGEGTDTVDASAKKITVNSPAAKKAYGTWLSLFSGKGLHKADTTADAYAHIQDAFVNGKVAAIVQGPWEITNFYKGSAFSDKSNLGIATVPAGSTGKAGAPTGGHNLSVYAGSDKAHQAASLKFVNFMTSAKSQATIALKNSTLPTRDDAYTDAVKANEGIAGYGTVLAAAQPRPALPEYGSLWGPLDTELPKIAGGKESLDKGLSNAELAISKLVPDFSK
jgi:arabinogalactan oligomer/maltooligosaccharide transport system substrate-binding protein